MAQQNTHCSCCSNYKIDPPAQREPVINYLDNFKFNKWDYSNRGTMNGGSIVLNPRYSAQQDETIIDLEFCYVKNVESDKFNQLLTLFPNNRCGSDLVVHGATQYQSSRMEIWPEFVEAEKELKQKDEQYRVIEKNLHAKIKQMVSEAGMIYKQPNDIEIITWDRPNTHFWYRVVDRNHFFVLTPANSPLAKKYTSLKKRGYDCS